MYIRRPPPIVNGIAVLQLLPKLFIKDLPAIMYDLHAKYGSVFTISLFGPKVTVLIGPEVLTHFFQGPELEISRGKSFEFSAAMFGQGVLYGTDAATRNEQIRFFVDALKPSKLRTHVDPMLQEVEAFFSRWGDEGVVDLKSEFEKILMFIASRCLLGKEVREKMFDEVYALWEDITNALNLFSVLFPYIPIPSNKRRDRARVELTKILSAAIRSRKGSERVEDDTLQKLVDSKYKDGRSTTDEEVTGLIIALLFAGEHTSWETSTWTAACLLSNVEWLNVATEEQRYIIRKYKGQIDYNALLEMDILHNCIKEALRMHSPTQAVIRKAHKQFSVQTKEGKEYDIPAGRTILSPIVINNNIPSIYKDPHVYDPDRFGPSRQEDKVGGKFSYTSFGGGRLACIGESFAYLQMKVIWSHLLRNFELKLMSPYPKAGWHKLSPGPQGKLMVSYKRHCVSST